MNHYAFPYGLQIRKRTVFPLYIYIYVYIYIYINIYKERTIQLTIKVSKITIIEVHGGEEYEDIKTVDEFII